MPRRQPVTFLMFNAFGQGGVARTVLNLANHLADHHPVDVVSLFRRRDEPRFPLDPRVRLTVLRDLSQDLGRVQTLLDERPTRLRPTPSETKLTLLTDLLLRRQLRRMEPGILVSTRPSLHLAARRWAPSGVRVVGQDHLNFPTRFANLRQATLLSEVVPELDGYVVLTNADAEDYRRALPTMHTPVAVIRNALPWSVAETPAPLDSKVVVAAGRLAREKGFDRLVDAFAPVARAHPDWHLNVYGEGAERAALTGRVRRLGLEDQVRLPGHTDDLRAVLGDASAYAMTSHKEGFPMVLIEAMSAGLPLVSFDCPRGPGEIVDDGKNGFLVDDGDVPGFTEALRMLVEDPELRRRCGRQAHADAEQYTAEAVVADWEAMFEHVGSPTRST